MKYIIMPTTSFPDLTESIKLAIGLSIWRLFQITSAMDSIAKYLLKTDDKSYVLGANGNVIYVLESDFSYQELAEVFFEGYVVPSDIRINSILNSL